MSVDVFLNIYKLHGSPDICSPCGLYHTSVQIGDLEYCFGEGSGVTCSTHNPRVDGIHGFLDGSYECSLHMGTCYLTGPELSRLLYAFHRAFPGDKYDLVHRNCNHFSDAMLRAIVGRGIPHYINRASRCAQCVSCLLPEAWKSSGEAAAAELQRRSANLQGLFGGVGETLTAGCAFNGISEVGLSILKRLLRLSDCLRTPTVADRPAHDSAGSEGTRHDRHQRRLVQKTSPF